jgi:uncharacterized protein (TIGR00369 family)
MNTFAQALEDWKLGGKAIAPIVDLLKVELVGFSKGKAILKMHAHTVHHNAMGTVHGGVFCDIGDLAMGCALSPMLNEGEYFTTVELSTNYLKKVVDDVITATATVIRRGRRIIFVECELHNSVGKLICKMKSTCMVLT